MSLSTAIVPEGWKPTRFKTAHSDESTIQCKREKKGPGKQKKGGGSKKKGGGTKKKGGGTKKKGGGLRKTGRRA